MFTGIIQEIAEISFLEKLPDFLRYSVKLSQTSLDDLRVGASVSIDGVCQTVVSIESNQVFFEAIEETLSKTTLKNLQLGSKVNIERSCKVGSEIGGHLLSGHIYGKAIIVNIDKNIWTFRASKNTIKYFFSKGFIALDGASLTLVDVDEKNEQFTIHLIPETLKKTTFGFKKIGHDVNVEIDSSTLVTVETIERILAARIH